MSDQNSTAIVPSGDNEPAAPLCDACGGLGWITTPTVLGMTSVVYEDRTCLACDPILDRSEP